MLAAGRDHWLVGERVYVYRRSRGRPGLLQQAARDETDVSSADEQVPDRDARDYDVEHYVRVLRDGFASRLARGLTLEDYEAIVADPDRPALFTRPLGQSQPVLNVLEEP
jgi:hypothetical protein